MEAMYNTHHKAILRMIRMTVEHAHNAGIWVGICGELGADIALTEEQIIILAATQADGNFHDGGIDFVLRICPQMHRI